MQVDMVGFTMLIDDSEIDLFIQRRFLEVYHFSQQLVTYKSAEEALNWLGNINGHSPPDVIFLDLNMPNVDGFAFLERFQKLPEKVVGRSKIVVLTSSNSKTDREHVSAFRNVVRFITKPIKQTDIEELKKIFP
jgi:CheY-like chemotaxis protein